ncbi:LysR family transcriptional regulator [Xanthomonas hortorum]|uniref:HTH-type transcriptional regulator DmlR n=1 Tax=Xanthomonas hortorum pv. pelargonii TaxID=453602 RepID=A0A6V7CDS8_9XANT|nr:LysR family transcriptional regulator [Xanthomonas hortorum]MCE4354822.1 LysR family transcriptional regulator [Xanthomonas hortorum pv. pelargonii]MCM5523509.1 LysR family transcriptional regulator [Xanthomonas hortorum pv. pelargonii]MCM5536152.1 LysR family transcriptional regulator [Xanthomonas hortorum pv. pelargonii]MCM5540152.1 LysR family transcriptional regulator [Xanthomonas hortorum pv. pelargonii]MCM5543641.1 LysR family transcriptional regulator [Xanthomonas hortorum pv. pelarg
MPTTHNRTESGPGGLGNLRRLAYFVAVVETGSFTAAAERLGITKAVVSQQVARLERECRTSLLVRTTRKVRTTELGQSFYQRCAAILRDTDDAFDALTDTAAEPSGLLRLTAPLDYGVRVVVPAIAAFTRRYPACKVDAILSDQTLDLMTANIELAIRVGWLAESSLQARKIGAFRQLLVAPSTMTAQLAGLTAPQDIATLPFIANTALRDHQRWHFAHATHAPQSVDVQPGIFLDATLAVREAVCQGAGISVLPDYVVADDLAAGRLLHVLPQWQLPSGGIHAVFPATRFRPAKVRAFVDVLLEQTAQQHAL